MNTVHLVGRAGQNPQMRYFESGKSLCKLSLAVNRTKKDEPPDWFELEMWGKTGEIAADYVRCGHLIGVEGSFKMDFWEDNSGERTKLILKVDRISLLEKRKEEVTE